MTSTEQQAARDAAYDKIFGKLFPEGEIPPMEDTTFPKSYQAGFDAGAAQSAHRVSELALKAIDDEPELPDAMVPEMWTALKKVCAEDDQEAMTEILRITVRVTKQGIRDRTIAALADGPGRRGNGPAVNEMREKLRATEEERDQWLKVAQRLFKMRPGNFIEQLERQGLNEEQLQNFLDAFELKSP